MKNYLHLHVCTLVTKDDTGLLVHIIQYTVLLCKHARMRTKITHACRELSRTHRIRLPSMGGYFPHFLFLRTFIAASILSVSVMWSLQFIGSQRR